MTLEKKGVDVHVASPVQKIEQDGDKLVVTLKNKKGEEVQVKADKVLMCVGRRPNTAGVFSEDLLKEYPDLVDAKGFIKVSSTPLRVYYTAHKDEGEKLEKEL